MKTTPSTSVMNAGLHVGRIVHYWQDTLEGVIDTKQPFAAVVSYVHPTPGPDGAPLVNLGFFDHSGYQPQVSEVQLYMPDPDDAHGVSWYATWMSYQVATASRPPTSP